MDISTLRTLVWTKLVMIILEWIWVPYVFWYGSISYDNVWMDLSTFTYIVMHRISHDFIWIDMSTWHALW
jgi:hypothetical protein